MKNLVIKKFDPRDDYERYLFCEFVELRGTTRVYKIRGIKDYKAFCKVYKDYDYRELDVSKEKGYDYFGYEREDRIAWRNR